VPQRAAGEGLLRYYEAIEQASADMLLAAQRGDWDRVVNLENACSSLISQLEHAAVALPLPPSQARTKARIMLRILRNDAQIRSLAEPWRDGVDALLAGQARTVH
jgi:flagellar protein FliT